MRSNCLKRKEIFLNSLRKKRLIFRRSIFLSSQSRIEFVVRLFSNNIVITLYRADGNPIYSASASSLKKNGNRRSKEVAVLLAKKVFEFYSSNINIGSVKLDIPIFNCHKYHGIRKIAYETFSGCFES